MTEEDLGLGPITGHAVGLLLKETVRRATVAIFNQRANFTAEAKPGHDGRMNDVCTSADRDAQEIYLRMMSECFPCVPVLAEEDGMHLLPKGARAYFTVDPLDGTKAYGREQSDGVGTMVALVIDGKVSSAYIGDINTQEVYGYRPGSEKTHRITRLDTYKELDWRPQKKMLNELNIMLRGPFDEYSDAVPSLVGMFKDYEIRGSSIGIWFARLWKKEVGALLLPMGHETPWDSTPVIGISKKLGYAFLRSTTGRTGWTRYEPVLPTEVMHRNHDMFVIHESLLEQL